VPIDTAKFRSALAQWPSGVGVVTTLGDGPEHAPHGMTASSFSSVSLDPPLVSICLGNHLPTKELVQRSGVFAVSILGKDQAAIGRRFAGMQPGVTDRFAEATWVTAATGAPVLADANAWLDCRVVYAHPGGDHTIFVGEVLATETPRVTAPLLFHSRAWGQLADPLPESITITVTPRSRVFAVATPDDVASAPEHADHIEFSISDRSDLARAAEVHAAADARGLRTIGYVNDAFTAERESTVLGALEELTGLGCVQVGCTELAEATPLQVRRVLQDARVRVRPAEVRVRLRAHHGLGLVNALVAMKSGVRHFDAVEGAAPDGLPAADLRLLARQLGVVCDDEPVADEALLSSTTS